jgi:hypothetical protein
MGPAETVMDYLEPLLDLDGSAYHARACGERRDDGLWEGWIEFEPIGPHPERFLRTPRETTQPNHTDLLYWARGISGIFLQGAFTRALPAP